MAGSHPFDKPEVNSAACLWADQEQAIKETIIHEQLVRSEGVVVVSTASDLDTFKDQPGAMGLEMVVRADTQEDLGQPVRSQIDL